MPNISMLRLHQCIRRADLLFSSQFGWGRKTLMVGSKTYSNINKLNHVLNQTWFSKFLVGKIKLLNIGTSRYVQWQGGKRGNILDFINMPKFCVKTKYKPTKTIFFLEKRKFMREKRNRAQPGEDNISSKNNKSEGMPNLI